MLTFYWSLTKEREVVDVSSINLLYFFKEICARGLREWEILRRSDCHISTVAKHKTDGEQNGCEHCSDEAAAQTWQVKMNHHVCKAVSEHVGKCVEIQFHAAFQHQWTSTWLVAKGIELFCFSAGIEILWRHVLFQGDLWGDEDWQKKIHKRAKSTCWNL